MLSSVVRKPFSSAPFPCETVRTERAIPKAFVAPGAARSWVKLFVDHGELSAFGCGDGLTLACRRLWRHETAGIDSTWH